MHATACEWLDNFSWWNFLFQWLFWGMGRNRNRRKDRLFDGPAGITLFLDPNVLKKEYLCFRTLFCYFCPSGSVQVLEKTILCGDKDKNICKYISLIHNFVGLLSCYNCRPAEKLIKIESEVTSNYLQNCALMIQIGDLIVKVKLVK